MKLMLAQLAMSLAILACLTYVVLMHLSPLGETRVTFVLLNNTATTQTEVLRLTMAESVCLNWEKRIWKQNWTVVGRDEEGREIPETDAACLPQ